MVAVRQARGARAAARSLLLRCPICGEVQDTGLASINTPFRCTECGETSKIANCIVTEDTSMDDEIP
jgi:hypothetical protein